MVGVLGIVSGLLVLGVGSRLSTCSCLVVAVLCLLTISIIVSLLFLVVMVCIYDMFIRFSGLGKDVK
jgi:hypothetical protein